MKLFKLTIIIVTLILSFALVLPTLADSCNIDLFDWHTEGNLLGWTMLSVEGGTATLNYVDNYAEFYQSGGGYSGGIIHSPAMNYLIKTGDVFSYTYELIGGNITHCLDLYTDADIHRIFCLGNESPAGLTTWQYDLSDFAGETLEEIQIYNADANSGDRYLNLYKIWIVSPDCAEPPSGETCPYVSDAHFTGAITDTWLTSGGAVITDSVLTLPASGIVAQNLSGLSSLTAYSAVISTTSPANATELTVRLGTQSQTLEITGTGRYTASFTTPNLGGPIAYSIQNSGESETTLDYTCLSPGYSGGASSGCLAPANGEFTTADNWAFMRGAQWDSPSQKAALPYTNVALVYSTSAFSLPSIITDSHILLSFTSHQIGSNTGAVMGRVRSGGSSVNWQFDTYQTDYIYEVSLNTLAGDTGADIAFVNPGLTGSDSISATADIVVDNVCIFTANRGPNLPTPYDPDQISPITIGFGYTSCNDVDGLLAFFGVNIQQYRATYAAGASVWDPIGWVPWLISAMWNILATWLCIFMAAFSTFLQAIEYIVNNILNYGNWLVRSGINVRAFLLSLWVWGLATFGNIGVWWNTAIALVVAWVVLSGGNVFIFLAFLIDFIVSGLYSWLVFLVSSLPDYLLPLFWNYFTNIINVFIAAWNLLLDSITLVINTGFEFIVSLWNMAAPVINALWSYATRQIMTVYEFGVTIFNMLVGLVELIWAFVINGVMTPIEFYNGFRSGVSSEAFSFLTACSDNNFWCKFFAGVQIINQTVGQSVLYPIVITGIVVVTAMILWRNFFKIFTVDIA